MPQGVSNREFARLDGCSHTAVQNGVKRGALKVFDDGTLDPKLAGGAWRAGNYKTVRGGKPRTAKRQLAAEPRQLAGDAHAEVASAAAPAEAWGEPRADARQLGVVSALSSFGAHIPALAAEAASRHGLSAEAAVGFFADFREVVRNSMDELMAEEGVSAEAASSYYDPDDGGPFMPLDDFRRPSEGDEERWARIVPASLRGR